MVYKNTILIDSNKRVAIISDTHLGSGMEKIHKIFGILDSYDFVVFNGDIFELYTHKLVDIIKNPPAKWLYEWMLNNPDKFVYVVGNSDGAMKEEAPFDVYDSATISCNKNVVEVIHGHQFDTEKRQPNIWVKMMIILNYWISKIFRVNIRSRLAEKPVPDNKSGYKQKKYINTIRRNAREYAYKNGKEFLVHGHTHQKSVNRYNLSRVITIVDQGSFYRNKSYVEIRRGLPRLIELKDVE